MSATPADPTAPSTDLAAAPAAIGVPELIGRRHGAFGVHGSGDTSGFGGLTSQIEMPPPTSRPYGQWFDAAIDHLAEDLAGEGIAADEAIEAVVVDRGELTIYLRREHLLATLRALRDDQDLRFELSLGVSGVHYPGDAGRELHAVYHLMSITHGGRLLRLEVTAPDADPHLPSSVAIYPTNDWHERETWDMFGLVFDGHPALARILMPDDWQGHPQRKDYPLGGIPIEFHGSANPAVDNRRHYS